MKNWRHILLAEKIKNLTKRKYKVEECSVSDEACVSGTVGIFAAASLVFFMVVTIVYALYVFVHVSGISDIAGVHVTGSLKSAAGEIIYGKTEDAAGYEGWLTYGNDVFQLKYPNDWTVQEMNDGKNIVSLKKYNNTGKKGADSLSETIFVSASQVPDNLSMKDILNEKGIAWNDAWKQEMIGGKPGIHTGEITADSGIVKDMIFWKFNDKLYSIEGDYLNANISDSENIFKKIIAQFKFI